VNDWERAKGYWEKVLALSPNHLGALLSLGGALVRESKLNEAAQYLSRAVETEPPPGARMRSSRRLTCARACSMSPFIKQSARSNWVTAKREWSDRF